MTYTTNQNQFYAQSLTNFNTGGKHFRQPTDGIRRSSWRLPYRSLFYGKPHIKFPFFIALAAWHDHQMIRPAQLCHQRRHFFVPGISFIELLHTVQPTTIKPPNAGELLLNICRKRINISVTAAFLFYAYPFFRTFDFLQIWWRNRLRSLPQFSSKDIIMYLQKLCAYTIFCNRTFWDAVFVFFCFCDFHAG